MNADAPDCDCTVAQRQRQKQQEYQNGQRQSQQRPKQRRSSPLWQWCATEACTVTTNNNNNNNSGAACSSSNWHAKIAKQRRRSKMPMAVQMKHENNSSRTNYCNFNKLNRLLIATVGLLITLAVATTTTTPTNTITMIAAVATTKTILSGTLAMTVPAAALLAPISLIGHMTVATAAAVPASSPLSAQQQQRQIQQQQLFAMLTKNRQSHAGEVMTAGGIDVGGGGEGLPASALAAAFVPKHLLELDAAAPEPDDTADNADMSLETAGFVADDGQRYEKAVKALAAAVNSKANGNSNDSNGGGRLFGVSASSECPKECKCLDAYFDCGNQLLDRIPVLPTYVQTL